MTFAGPFSASAESARAVFGIVHTRRAVGCCSPRNLLLVNEGMRALLNSLKGIYTYIYIYIGGGTPT